MVLKILDIARSTSTYYYQKNGRAEEKKVSEGRSAPGCSINKDGKKISGDGFAYGYRKLTKQLRRKQHLVINKKKVYRLV